MVLAAEIGLKIRDSQVRSWNQSHNWNGVQGMFGLRNEIGNKF